MKKLLLTLLKGLAFFALWTLGVALIQPPEVGDAAMWRLYAELIPLGCILVLTLLFGLLDKRRVSLVSSLGRDLTTGLITGLLWIGLSVGILMAAGNLAILGGDGVPRLWLWLLAVLLNAAMQELLVRGYLYKLIKTNYSRPAAVIVTTALFTLAHGGVLEAGPVPILNVISMSLFMTAVLEYTGSLLPPILIHFVWNAVGAVLLGGVRLAEDYPSLLIARFSGSTLLSGGEYMLEGSLVVLGLNLAFALGFFVAGRRGRR